MRRCFTLDILGEAVIAEAEAEQHFAAYLNLLEAVAPEVARWPADPLIDRDDRGHTAMPPVLSRGCHTSDHPMARAA